MISCKQNGSSRTTFYLHVQNRAPALHSANVCPPYNVNLQLLSWFFSLGQDMVTEASTGKEEGEEDEGGEGEGAFYHEQDGQDAVGRFVKALYQPFTSPFFFKMNTSSFSFLYVHFISAE